MSIRICPVVLGFLLAVAVPRPAWAQEEPASSGVTIDVEVLRALLVEGLEANKMMDVEFALAIPDSALRWAPTPGVRDFVQQLNHTAVDNALFIARGVLYIDVPSFGDTAVYLNDKQALVQSVTASYDWVIGTLQELPAEELLEETKLFGRQMTKWRVYLQALEHAYWTRGQMVPYFRIHGMGPPEYRPF